MQRAQNHSRSKQGKQEPLHTPVSWKEYISLLTLKRSDLFLSLKWPFLFCIMVFSRS